MRNESELIRTYIMPSVFITPLRKQTTFDYTDLRFALYPFDRVCIEFENLGDILSDDSNEGEREKFNRFRRAYYTRVDPQTHRVVVDYEQFGHRISLYAQVRIDEERRLVFDVTNELRIPPRDRALGGGSYAFYWLPFVALCHALAQTRTHFEVVDVPLPRHERRAHAREGRQSPQTLVLRPGSTFRQAAREFIAARREAIRSHPRRHNVAGHLRRLVGADGAVRSVPVTAHVRGGRGQGSGRHDVRLLTPTVEGGAA